MIVILNTQSLSSLADARAILHGNAEVGFSAPPQADRHAWPAATLLRHGEPHREGDNMAKQDLTLSCAVTLSCAEPHREGDNMAKQDLTLSCAFTAPMFDEFMRRIMPGDEWRTS